MFAVSLIAGNIYKLKRTYTGSMCCFLLYDECYFCSKKIARLVKTKGKIWSLLNISKCVEYLRELAKNCVTETADEASKISLKISGGRQH